MGQPRSVPDAMTLGRRPQRQTAPGRRFAPHAAAGAPYDCRRCCARCSSAWMSAPRPQQHASCPLVLERQSFSQQGKRRRCAAGNQHEQQRREEPPAIVSARDAGNHCRHRLRMFADDRLERQRHLRPFRCHRGPTNSLTNATDAACAIAIDALPAATITETRGQSLPSCGWSRTGTPASTARIPARDVRRSARGAFEEEVSDRLGSEEERPVTMSVARRCSDFATCLSNRVFRVRRPILVSAASTSVMHCRRNRARCSWRQRWCLANS